MLARRTGRARRAVVAGALAAVALGAIALAWVAWLSDDPSPQVAAASAVPETMPPTSPVDPSSDRLPAECDLGPLDAVKAQVATMTWTTRTDATFAVHSDPGRCLVIVTSADLTAEEQAALLALGDGRLTIEHGEIRRL